MNLGRGTRALPTDPGTAHRPQGSGDTVWRALTGATEHGRQSRAWTPTAWAGLARSFPHQRGRPQAPRQLNPQGSLVWSLRMGEAPSFHCVIIPTTEVSFLPRLSPGAARGERGRVKNSRGPAWPRAHLPLGAGWQMQSQCVTCRQWDEAPLLEDQLCLPRALSSPGRHQGSPGTSLRPLQ